MNPIGGYFSLEEYVGGSIPYWIKDAVPLQSGRMALLFEVLQKEVKTIWLPSYYCTAVPELLGRLGYQLKFYGLTYDYRADLPDTVANDDLIILVDYFGLTGQFVQKDIVRFESANVIVDACMSFWFKLDCTPVFYSPRKFFGVPDGGYLKNPSRRIWLEKQASSLSKERMRHLELRKVGKLDLGREAFQRSEETFFYDDKPKLMSVFSQKSIKNINFDNAYKKRRENYNYLKMKFAEVNVVSQEIPENTAPLCFPMPHKNSIVIRRELASKGIFCPHYWPGIKILKSDVGGKKLSQETVFLPIDQRYSKAEMDFIISEIRRLI